MDKAAEIARRCYGDHPAAVALIMTALYSRTADQRERSRRALLLLDPLEPLIDPHVSRLLNLIRLEACLAADQAAAEGLVESET